MKTPNLRMLAIMASACGTLTFAGIGATAAGPTPDPGGSAAPPAQASPACTAGDLALREVSVTAGPIPEAVYAFRNRAGAACRISGGVGIRLFDAQGKPIPLRFGPRSAMPMLLTLASGDEASFTVSYGRPGTAQCATSARIEVTLAPQPTPVSAPASFTACAFPAVRISGLRLGVPSPAPEPSSG